MSKLLLFLSFFTYGVATNAQSVSSDRFATVDDVAGHRVILYDVGQMKSMKHIPIHMMNEKGKLRAVKDTLVLSVLSDGMRFDEPAVIEQVKKDTYVKLVKDGVAYYFLVDEKDNPFLPAALRNYDYWTEMLARFREEFTYREMAYKNSSMCNDGEQAGKYAEVTWTKINIPSSRDCQVTFSYEVEGSVDELAPSSIDKNVFLSETAVNAASKVYEDGLKKIREFRKRYEYVNVYRSHDFRYKDADLLVSQYLPLTWTTVFLPQGHHDLVMYRVSGGQSYKDYSESDILSLNGTLMSTDDVIRKEIGEEWVDVAYKETDDESDNAQAAESVKAIHVDGFELDESDLTAMQQGTSVQDKDGNRCALIKIETKESDLTFDVGTQGIVKTEHKTGEEWLYVPSGIRAIQISHPQYGSYQYVIPRKVEKGRTYNMQLSFDKKTEARRKGEITQGLKDAMKKYIHVSDWSESDFINGLAQIFYGGKLIINKDGREIVPDADKYKGRDLSEVFGEGLIAVPKNDKYGFVDVNGNLVIPYSYDDAMKFSDGLAPVAKIIDGEEKWGFIDKTGELKIEYQYEDVLSGFSNGIAATTKDREWPFTFTLINKNGEEIMTNSYSLTPYNGWDPMFDERYVWIDGMMLVERENEFGIIDSTGKEIVPCEYECECFLGGLSGLSSIHNGYAYLQYYDHEVEDRVGKLFDRTGKNVLKEKDVCSGLYDGLVMIYENGKFGFVTLSGKVIIPPRYDATSIPSEGLIAVGQYTGKEMKWGFIDRLGKQIIPFIYDVVENFSEGYAAVCKLIDERYKWGYIDSTGKMISDFKYSSFGTNDNGSRPRANSFSDGLVMVRISEGSDAEEGYMDRYGNDTFEE